MNGDMGRGVTAEVRAMREDSVVVAEFGALENSGGRPVRFAVLRGAGPEGTWLVEITPYLLGTAGAEDLRNFARGILDTLSAGAGESDFFTLYNDTRNQVQAVIGFDEGLPYLIVDAYTEFAGNRTGTSTSDEPVYAHMEAVSPSRADPAALESGARALLGALGA
ncbi:hypothetical protein J0X20_00355 [Streptomyces sp. KCTC 0041BP]|uniref:hypothetical protein n=2 Tax=Streptomyces TaxID=1883 RepID=UPI001AE8174A|nr:hypothetical protein [Streptomyces sp. KCTC 0041BP]MBP0932105.1 hypothetical protein [Streptomyces sp. KCTC 0041BP]